MAEAGGEVTRPALAKVFPLPLLPDGRRPYLTSGFHARNPSRPGHMGADFFYRWMATLDPPQKLGDVGHLVSANNSRPMSQRRISDVPAPIS